MRLFERKLDGFRFMVMKAAWDCWRRLPRQTQSWIGPDDLIQDGMEWMYREAKERWNPDKASLSTFLHVAIEHYFYDHYTQKYGRPNRSEENGRRYGSERRWEGNHESIEDKQQFYQERGMEFELERALGVRVQTNLSELKIIQCVMVRSMGEIYLNATVELKVEMSNWFLGEKRRCQFDTRKFLNARKEFHRLARWYQVDIEDCRHMLQHQECKNELRSVMLPFGKKNMPGKPINLMLARSL